MITLNKFVRLFRSLQRHSPPVGRIAAATETEKERSFLDLFGSQPLQTVFQDYELKFLNVEADKWLNFPPADFLDWARTFPRYHFEGVPDLPKYLKPPSFLLCQTHRIWRSAWLVTEQSDPDLSIADFGSFPFFLPIVLRDYFKHRGRLIATTIQPIPQETISVANHYGMELDVVDLDPYVVDRNRGDDLPVHLSCPDGSVDVVTMMHVIEHLYHPISALREAHRILKRGGRLIITTDNAMNLNTLFNYVSGIGYTFEPVEGTAAMSMSDWRGHVRFFSSRDLQTLIQATGFATKCIGYDEIFYDVFHSEYFRDPRPYLPAWRKAVLEKYKQFANDIFIVGTKT